MKTVRIHELPLDDGARELDRIVGVVDRRGVVRVDVRRDGRERQRCAEREGSHARIVRAPYLASRSSSTRGPNSRLAAASSSALSRAQSSVSLPGWRSASNGTVPGHGVCFL